jgi:hypothetical protein
MDHRTGPGWPHGYVNEVTAGASAGRAACHQLASSPDGRGPWLSAKRGTGCPRDWVTMFGLKPAGYC